MRSEFQQWLMDLQSIADKEEIIIRADLYDYLNYAFKMGKNLDTAFNDYKLAIIRINAINNKIIPKSIINLETERFEWSLETFPEATALSSILKLKEEADEIEFDIVSGVIIVEEYADALMCLFDSAGRQGISVQDIFDAFERKLAVNKSRTWIKNPDNTYSHIKP